MLWYPLNSTEILDHFVLIAIAIHRNEQRLEAHSTRIDIFFRLFRNSPCWIWSIEHVIDIGVFQKVLERAPAHSFAILK
jgi:hypothetical protein